MSVWSLSDASRTSPLQGHLTVLKVTVTVCHTAEHYGEEYDDKQWRLEVAAALFWTFPSAARAEAFFPTACRWPLVLLRVRLTENRQQIQDHHITFTSLFLKSIVPFGYFLCVLILCDKLNWISQFLSARKFNVLSMSYRIAIRTVSNVGERAIIRDCRSCAIAEIFSRVHSRRTELKWTDLYQVDPVKRRVIGHARASASRSWLAASLSRFANCSWVQFVRCEHRLSSGCSLLGSGAPKLWLYPPSLAPLPNSAVLLPHCDQLIFLEKLVNLMPPDIRF